MHMHSFHEYESETISRTQTSFLGPGDFCNPNFVTPHLIWSLKNAPPFEGATTSKLHVNILVETTMQRGLDLPPLSDQMRSGGMCAAS
jgi:hypothetical protein